jgi:quercetin dioxygenase-like cupin family protein
VLHRWSEMPSQELAPGINRRFLTAARMTIARFSLARGAVVPIHSHDHEQVSYVLSGALRFTVSGEEVLVTAGEALQIPSWAEHGVRVEEDAEVIDVFCPVRQDWIDGTDTYFKK